jgi:hypothetical protein
MSSRILFRSSGLALILGSLIFVVSTPLASGGAGVSAYANPLLLPARVGQMVAGALLLIGLPGLYLRQAGQAGKLGFISFAMTFLGNAAHWNLLPVLSFAEVLLAGRPETQALVAAQGGLDVGALFMGYFAVSSLTFYLGVILLGIATLRARVFPRAAAALLIISPIITFMVLPTGLADQSPVVAAVIAVMFVSGFVWCGYTLWAGTHE